MKQSKQAKVEGIKDPDDAPDLSSPNWAKKIALASVDRGRSKPDAKKL